MEEWMGVWWWKDKTSTCYFFSKSTWWIKSVDTQKSFKKMKLKLKYFPIVFMFWYSELSLGTNICLEIELKKYFIWCLKNCIAALGWIYWVCVWMCIKVFIFTTNYVYLVMVVAFGVEIVHVCWYRYM